MPIYEFKCAKCGKVFEKLVSVSETRVPDCTYCGSSDAKKMFSAFGFMSSGKSKSSLGSGASCSTCSSSNCSTCGA